MINSKIIHVLGLFLSITISWFNSVFTSLPEGTLVVTPNGPVRVEKLKVGDKILSYNFNSTKTKTTLTKVAITKINKRLLEAGFSIYTGKYRWIDASPQHLFFVLQAEQESGNVGIVADFVQAQYLREGDMLIDVDLTCIPIRKIRRADWCTKTLDKKSRVKEIRTVKIYGYAIEVKKPHTFLVTESTWNEEKERRLLLTHNGLPALAAGISFAFESTPASISFTEATLASGGLYASLGPAGLALGLITGCGLLGYQLFRNRDDKQVYLERVDQCNPSGDKEKKSNKEDEKSKEKSDGAIDKILQGTKQGEKKRSTKQFEKPGGFDEALDDFENMGLTGVKDASNGEKIVKIGKLPDGKVVNVRNKSDDSRPTLEVYDGKKSIKIRYGSK